MLRKVLLPVTLVLVAPQMLRAQQAGAQKAEIGFAIGGSAMPDALSSQCGSKINGDGSAGAELGMSVLRRLGHAVAVQVDTRVIAAPTFASGCYAVLPAVDTAYASSLSRNPLVTSTIRLAVETPRSMPLFRLSAGTGVVWGSPALPVGVLALAWSTRGEHRRFFIEFERLQARVHAEERYNFLRAEQQPFSRPIVTYPAEHTLRFGLAWMQD